MVQGSVKKHPEWPELTALLKQVVAGHDRCQPEILAGAIANSLSGTMVDALMGHYSFDPHVGRYLEQRRNHHERVRRIIHEICPDLDPEKVTAQVERIAAEILGSFHVSPHRLP